MRCWVGGVAVLGPGLPGWKASEAVLAGAAPWTPADCVVPAPAMLPPTERRRTSLAVRLALAAAAEASADEEDARALETVFASSNGDGAVVGAILETLTDPAGGAISPTQFHNSVHNAAAGYWGIGIGSTSPSISVGGHDDTVAAGLLQAAAAVSARRRRTLFCAYDAPLPPPLAAVRRTTVPFAAAMVLLPEPDASARAVLDLRFRPGAGVGSAEAADPLDALAAENPAARALPLLRALAARRAAALRMPLLGDARLEIDVAPC
jgi:hypothetical protein